MLVLRLKSSAVCCLLSIGLSTASRIRSNADSNLSVVSVIQHTSNNQDHKSPSSLVNLLAGANMNGDMSAGNVLPITARPWGFNHWAVQSAATKKDPGTFWFHPGDLNFAGLRCTHQPSPWIGDYGWFLIQPVFDAHSDHDGMYQPATTVFKPYLFKTQVMQKGYEDRGSIQLEATPTMHGALVRVTHPNHQGGAVKFKFPSGSWKMDPSNSRRVLGETSVNAKNGFYPGNFKMYVVVEAPEHIDWRLEGVEAWLLFNIEVNKITYDARIATSFISHDFAARSLDKEVGTKSLEELVVEARSEWDGLMSRVQVEFADESRNAVFYTNLYRGMLFPRNFAEADSTGDPWHYSAYTGVVVRGPAVADQGMWDAYRSVYPMLSIFFPDKLGEIIAGWLSSYKEGKWLTTWSSPGQRLSMVGTMGDCAVSDAIVKSLQGFVTGFDIQEAYAAIWHDATTMPDKATSEKMYGRAGLNTYIEKGFVPSTDQITNGTSHQDQSAALTLNYMLADASISLAAKAMGKDKDSETMKTRSDRFGVIFDKEKKHFRAVDVDGKWKYPDFHPQRWLEGFTEANAAIYRFYVPHNVAGLIDLYGGRDAFCSAMEETIEHKLGGLFFETGGYGQIIHEMREAAALEIPFGFYLQANQPAHHVLYVAIVGGCASFGQKMLRRAMAETYTINGWSGDEDNGEMASWYTLSALGIYSLVPGSDDLVLGSPEVSSAVLRIPNPKNLKEIREIHIEADGNSEEAVYVDDVLLNGKAVTGSSVKYPDIMKSSNGQPTTLRFQMSAFPGN